jgi:hypothetical protein
MNSENNSLQNKAYFSSIIDHLPSHDNRLHNALG